MAPVNETDMVLFPEGLKALKKGAKEVVLDGSVSKVEMALFTPPVQRHSG